MKIIEAPVAEKSEDIVSHSNGEEVYFLLIYSSKSDRESYLQELDQEFPNATVVVVPHAEDYSTFESIYLPEYSNTVVSLYGLGLIASCQSLPLDEFITDTKRLGSEFAG